MPPQYDSSYPPDAAPAAAFGGHAAAQRTNQQGLATMSAHSAAPANPIDNMLWLDTSSEPALLKIYDSVSATWKLWGVMVDASPSEVIAARGNLSSLNDRLQAVIGDDGQLLTNATENISEWVKHALAGTYVSTTSFTLTGDVTGIFSQRRRLKVDLSGGPVYVTVASSSYAASPGLTTITVEEASLDGTMTDVWFSVIHADPTKTALNAKSVPFTATALNSAASVQAALENLETLAPFNPGHIRGGIMSRDTDTDHDTATTALTCRDAADSVNMTLAAFVKQIDANWALGSAAGGFPSGLTLTADTWYHYFVIDTTSGAFDAGYDSSLTAANLLTDSGGTKYRRIGSVLVDGSANIIAYTQEQDGTFLWNDPPLDYSNTAHSGTRTTITLSVPPDIKFRAIINALTGGTGGAAPYVNINSLDVNDEAPSTTNAPLGNPLSGPATGVIAQREEIWTNTSKQISARTSGNPNCTVRIATIGWRDDRGRNS